jgi:hypothetical protein
LQVFPGAVQAKLSSQVHGFVLLDLQPDEMEVCWLQWSFGS